MGKGETVEFENFTFAHVAPILFAAVIIYLIYFFRNKLVNPRCDKVLRYTMAFTMIVSVFIMALAVTVLFGLAYLPWFLMDRKAKKANDEKSTEEAETALV